jgi:hypothetical protein
MKLKKTLAQGLAVAGLVAAIGTLGGSPAQAATGYNRCPANRMCVFTGVNGTGAIGIFTVGDANLGDSVGPRGLNNNIESAWNRRGDEWALWNDAGYQGGITLFYDGARGNITARYRNITSSLASIRA